MPKEKTATNVISLVDKGKLVKAEEVILRWLDKNPNDFHALGNYTDIMMRRANHGLAIHLYRYLLREWTDMPEYARSLIWANIGQSLLLEGFQTEAEHAFTRAVEINDKEPGIYNAMGCCYINQGQPDKVIEHCDKALSLDPEMRQAKWNRAVAYLEKGEWAEGWPGYDEGERVLKQRSYKEGESMKQWTGKRNQTVVAWGEQGVGDEILFGTCLPDFIKKVKNPIIDCHPRLEKTFKRSFPGVPIYGTRKTKEITWHHKHKIDRQISIASLPKLFRNSADKFPGKPYLKADPERIKVYRENLEKLGPGPYVGIAWFGGEKKTRFDYRAIPLTEWGPIFDTGATFVSIQYNKWGHKQDAAKAGITHWDKPVDDLDEQMALIMACDLVISVCQSVVHFSGALGKECWCLTPARPAWRYGLTDDKMVWYGDAVTLIRQLESDREKESGQWDSVIKTAADKLIEYKEQYNARNIGEPSLRVDGFGGVRTMAEGQPQPG